MSDFLLVVPDGWTEVPDATNLINNTVGVSQLQQWIAGMEWGNMSPWLELAGLIPENATITAANFFDTGDAVDPYRLWFEL